MVTVFNIHKKEVWMYSKTKSLNSNWFQVLFSEHCYADQCCALSIMKFIKSNASKLSLLFTHIICENVSMDPYVILDIKELICLIHQSGLVFHLIVTNMTSGLVYCNFKHSSINWLPIHEIFLLFVSLHPLIGRS